MARKIPFRIPQIIPICGHFYQVMIVDGLNAKDQCAGQMDPLARTIELDADLCDHPDYMMDVLLHEIKHAVHKELGWTEFLSHELQELEVQTSASTHTSLFKLEFKEEWLSIFGEITPEDIVDAKEKRS
jgi:hypothetical protein